MKRANLIFTTLLIPVDFSMLILAGLAAYFLRVSPFFKNIWPVMFETNLPFERYFGLVLVVAASWLFIFALAGLYRIKRKKILEEMFQVVVATSLGIMGIVMFIFLRHELFNSRFLVLAAWGLSILFIILGRVFLRILKDFFVGKFDFGVHRVLVIGNDRSSESISKEIDFRPGLGLRIFKQIPEIDMDSIKEVVKNPQVEEVILSSFDYPPAKIIELIDFCHENRLTFRFVPNILGALTQNTDIDTLGGVPLVELKRTRLDGWGRVVKRIVDMVGATLAIIIFLPSKLFLALLIKIDSPGPIIYKNRRVGPDGEFDVYKFRTMKIEHCTGPGYPKSEEASHFEDELVKKLNIRRGPVFKVLNDPRRTRVGRILEKFSFDELPQFFNVLKGEMSLVGPRPHMPKEVAGYTKLHRKVFNIKPGITGLPQISGRSDLDFDEEAKLDIYYIENWSPLLDFIILAKTPFVMFFKKHRQ